MLSAVLILLLTLFIVFRVSVQEAPAEESVEADGDKNPQIKKLWTLAQNAMRERKPIKAEKVLLTILKFDEKNAAAYNRLGILYAREKHYKEAIECFEIAQSLDNNASSLHNVGLIYLETGKYEKAEMAFAQAIELEGDQPGRYIAHAKALEKLGRYNKATEALETAYSLNPSTVILRHLLELYEHSDDQENIELTKRRIEELQAERAAKALEEKKAKRRARAAKTTKTAKTAAGKKPKRIKKVKTPKPAKPQKVAKTKKRTP
ncbi:tetratricopeptide repeat protein [Candidatus Saccharibacteria bacterium]|nr:tetratricopeptide repeat protein [Candidatus Saccharibacteria bacterium]